MANPPGSIPLSPIGTDATRYTSAAPTPSANPAQSREDAARIDKMLEQAQIPMARLSPNDRAKLEAYYGKVLGDTSAIGGRGASLDLLANGNWRNLLTRAGVPVPGDGAAVGQTPQASAGGANQSTSTPTVQGAHAGGAATKVGHKHSHYKTHVMFMPVAHSGQILGPGEVMGRFLVRKEKVQDPDDAGQQQAQDQSGSAGSSQAAAGAAGGPAGAGAGTGAGAGNSGGQGSGGGEPGAQSVSAVGNDGGDDGSGFALQNQDGEQINIPDKGGELRTSGTVRMSFVAGAHELQGDGSTLLAFQNLDDKPNQLSFGGAEDTSAMVAREEKYLRENPNAPDAPARRAFLEKMKSAPGNDGAPSGQPS
jgi:hypothetical protein